MSSEPKFSAYPFDRLPRLSRREAVTQSLVARWLSATSSSLPRLTKLAGTPRIAMSSASVSSAGVDDRFAARCMIRVGGALFEARASSGGIRRLAQKLFGGPDELAAPRPLTFAEDATWSLLVDTALQDLGIAGQVWPSPTPTSPSTTSPSTTSTSTTSPSTTSSSTIPPSTTSRSTTTTPRSSISLDVVLGDIPLAVAIEIPADLDLRVPPAKTPPAWADRIRVDATVVVGRCALHREDLARLRVRSLITIERTLELEVLAGSLGLRAEPRAVVAEVATGYVGRPMPDATRLPDDAHVELSVALGTTQLSLRQVFELSVGQIVSLGRPLAGPFEVRAAGRLVGKGELVDVDGELAVRIVSVGDQE